MPDDIVIISGADVDVVSGGYAANPLLSFYNSLSIDDIAKLSTDELIAIKILRFEEMIECVKVSEAVSLDNMDVCPLLGLADKYMVLIDDISEPISLTYLQMCLQKAKDFYDQSSFHEAYKVLFNPYTRDIIKKMRLAK